MSIEDAIQFADDRPTSCDEVLYQWAVDAEEVIRNLAAMVGAHQPAPSAAAEEVDKALNDYAQAFTARAMGWTREHGDAMPDARTKLYSAISSYARGLSTTSPTPQADSQPAPQGETNAQLDTDSNSSAPGQQRDVDGTVALGQPVGNGSDQAAGDPSAQGDKLLTVAERNIRSFLRSAVFKSESDREAALNCVDVLWEAARAPADSVTAPAVGANWQDISTAPKDGTRFVAVGQNYGLDSEAQHTCMAQWFRGCWIEVSEWNEISELKYLTHWMPLPPLPGNAARKQGDE